MFEIRPLLKLLLLVIPAAAGLLLLINLLRLRQSIEWKTAIRRCIRWLPAVLAAVVAWSVLCTVYLWTGTPHKSSFKISFTYPKASKGLTPSGTPLDVNEIFSDAVLEILVRQYPTWNVSLEELRNTLKTGYVKQRSISVDDLYVSTEYIISYQATEHTESLDKDVLMRALSKAYYEYFVSKYGRKTDVLEADYSKMGELDYLDVYTYLSNRADMLIRYLELCASENADFVSEKTGESFRSIMDKAQNFQNVALERFESYILKYGVSIDSGQYISRLNFENRLEDVEYMKNLAAYSVRLAAIDRYDGEITRSVLVPTKDESGEFYQSRTKIGTDYFANDANRFLEGATANQLTIETNNYYIESIAAGNGGAAYRQKADEMVRNLEHEIVSLSKLAVDTIKDYEEWTSNGYMNFSFQEKTAVIRSYVKRTVLYAAVLFLEMIAVILTNPPLHGRKKEKKRLRPISSPAQG